LPDALLAAALFAFTPKGRFVGSEKDFHANGPQKLIWINGAIPHAYRAGSAVAQRAKPRLSTERFLRDHKHRLCRAGVLPECLTWVHKRRFEGRPAILVICLLSAHLAGGYLIDSPFRRLVEESFLILGWVANWRPLEIFLYDWLPLARRRDLYRRLAAAIVELKSYAVPKSEP